MLPGGPVVRIAVALTLLVIGSALTAQSTRLTGLDRAYEARGWEAVGRLDLGAGFCTGTLIAPDLVLTAAHCVYDARARLIEAGRITFHAGLRYGDTAARVDIARVAAHPGFAPRAPFTAQNIEHDVALLKLSRPIPSHVIAPFVLHEDKVTPGAVSVVSYGQARAEVAYRQRRCMMTRRHRDLLMFDCAATFGSSGAPVFSHLNGRGRILSVISGGTPADEPGAQTIFGPYLPPLVADLKTALRAAETGPVANVRRIGVGESGRADRSGAKFVPAR